MVITLATILGGKPDQINWRRSLNKESKDPYGTYAFSEYVQSLFTHIEVNRNSFQEMLDTLSDGQSLLSVSQYFNPSHLEMTRLLNYAERGNSILIVADNFDSNFLDTIGLAETDIPEYLEFMNFNSQFRYSINDFFVKDTVQFQFSNVHLKSEEKYILRRTDYSYYFEFQDDTTNTFKIIAVDSENMPVIIRKEIGDGQLILCSTPYFFTNIYLLHDDNEQVVRNLLSYIPTETLIWTEFYERGRPEARTPLRYILSRDSLRWAMYITLISLFVYSLIEVRRKFRAIPIVVRPPNQTLNFVKTVGNLYFEKSGNRNIALKRIRFFADQVRSRYFVNLDFNSKSTADILSRKSGVNKDLVEKIINYIIQIKEKGEITTELLEDFSRSLDEFYEKSEN